MKGDITKVKELIKELELFDKELDVLTSKGNISHLDLKYHSSRKVAVRIFDLVE